MKKSVLLLIVLLIVSCSFRPSAVASSYTSEFSALVEQAKQGDSEAYRLLADCYRDGIGVKQDFLNMVVMAMLSADFGGMDINSYLKTIPENHNYHLLAAATEAIDNKHEDRASVLAKQMLDKGMPEGYLLQGIFALMRNDTLESKRLIEKSAKRGSVLAELLMCTSDWPGATDYNVEKLLTLTDKAPYANVLLGNIYIAKDSIDLAAHYYMKADKQAFLGRREIQLLLQCYRSGAKVQLLETDVQRLQRLVDSGKTVFFN